MRFWCSRNGKSVRSVLCDYSMLSPYWIALMPKQHELLAVYSTELGKRLSISYFAYVEIKSMA
jgi:hypothetical protein